MGCLQVCFHHTALLHEAIHCPCKELLLMGSASSVSSAKITQELLLLGTVFSPAGHLHSLETPPRCLVKQ